MTVAGWVVLGVIGVLLAEAAFLTLLDWLYKRALGPKTLHVDTRIWDLQARVNNLEAALEASARGEGTIAQSSGAMRAGHKPYAAADDVEWLRHGRERMGPPPPPSPFPIRSMWDSPRKRKDLGLEDFHD